MALRAVALFQRRIYEILRTDSYLKQNTVGVFFSIQQDGKYPFIWVNFLKLEDLSKYEVFNCELEFEICLFGRDKAQEQLLILADHVRALLAISEVRGADFNLIALKAFRLEWVRGQDLITTKLIMRYKVLLGDC